MDEAPRPMIYAHWAGRAYPVRWPAHRAEPRPGDVVRLDVYGSTLWRSFRVVGRRDWLAGDVVGAYPVAIDLDVEPIGRPTA
jgi:hypothetical protein